MIVSSDGFNTLPSPEHRPRSQAAAVSSADSPPPLRDRGAKYEAGRARITELVAGLDGDAAATEVPACPTWSVHAVVAHLTGVCADIIVGNVQPTPDDSWTAAQVEARKEQTLTETLEEWDDVGPKVAAIIDDFPGHYGAQMVADVTVHEHDLRGALAQRGARESDGLTTGLDYLMDVLVRPSMGALGLGPLEVRADGRNWVVGTDDPPSGDPDAAWRDALISPELPPPPSASPVGSLELSPFELFRAVTGRRSAAQIKRFDWTTEPDPFLPMFGLGPFTTRSTDLIE